MSKVEQKKIEKIQKQAEKEELKIKGGLSGD